MDRVVAQLLAEIDGAQVIFTGLHITCRLRAAVPYALTVCRMLEHLRCRVE